MADPATLRVLAEQAAEKRSLALASFTFVAESAHDVSARLRFEPNNAEEIEKAADLIRGLLEDGLSAYSSMLGILADMRRLTDAPDPKVLVSPADREAKLAELSDSIAATAEVAQGDLGELASMLRNKSGDGADVFRVATGIREAHERLFEQLGQAALVENCRGSA